MMDAATRQYIAIRIAAIRDAIGGGKNPGKRERAILKSVKEIEEVVK